MHRCRRPFATTHTHTLLQISLAMPLDEGNNGKWAAAAAAAAGEAAALNNTNTRMHDDYSEEEEDDYHC